jgi:hypothetical protein
MAHKKSLYRLAEPVRSGSSDAGQTGESPPKSDPVPASDSGSTSDSDPGLDFTPKWGAGDQPITSCRTCGGHGSYGYGNPCPECGAV